MPRKPIQTRQRAQRPTFTCELCGDPITTDRHYSSGTMPKHIFCKREHDVEWRKAHNFFKAISEAGREKRIEAVKKSNSVNPHRRRKDIANGDSAE